MKKSFETERLVVELIDDCKDFRTEDVSDTDILEVLAPKVTEHLPPGWQGIGTPEQARRWLQDRQQEGGCCLVWHKPGNGCAAGGAGSIRLAGFLFQHRFPAQDHSGEEIRIGYLLAKSGWGFGLATELIYGLLNASRAEVQANGAPVTVVGGVARHNSASIRVLEKCGFQRVSPSAECEAQVDSDTRFYRVFLDLSSV